MGWSCWVRAWLWAAAFVGAGSGGVGEVNGVDSRVRRRNSVMGLQGCGASGGAEEAELGSSRGERLSGVGSCGYSSSEARDLTGLAVGDEQVRAEVRVELDAVVGGGQRCRGLLGFVEAVQQEVLGFGGWRRRLMVMAASLVGAARRRARLGTVKEAAARSSRLARHGRGGGRRRRLVRRRGLVGAQGARARRLGRGAVVMEAELAEVLGCERRGKKRERERR